MVLDLEVELRRRADVAQHDGVLLAAVGHVVERRCWGSRGAWRLRRSSTSASSASRSLMRVAEGAHGGDRVRGVAAGLLDAAIVVAGALALGAHALDLGEQPAALLLDGEELVERRRGVAAAAASDRRTSSGLERTILTSSIVTPRGRVGRAHGIAPARPLARAPCYARRTISHAPPARAGAADAPEHPSFPLPPRSAGRGRPRRAVRDAAARGHRRGVVAGAGDLRRCGRLAGVPGRLPVAGDHRHLRVCARDGRVR